MHMQTWHDARRLTRSAFDCIEIRPTPADSRVRQYAQGRPKSITLQKKGVAISVHGSLAAILVEVWLALRTSKRPRFPCKVPETLDNDLAALGLGEALAHLSCHQAQHSVISGQTLIVGVYCSRMRQHAITAAASPRCDCGEVRVGTLVTRRLGPTLTPLSSQRDI